MGVSVPDEESVRKKILFFGLKKAKNHFLDHKVVFNRRDF